MYTTKQNQQKVIYLIYRFQKFFWTHMLKICSITPANRYQINISDIRLTTCWMAVKTINTKVICCFMLNHILYYHFSEKTTMENVIQLFKIFFQGLFGQCHILGFMPTAQGDGTQWFVLIGAAPDKNIESLILKVE